MPKNREINYEDVLCESKHSTSVLMPHGRVLLLQWLLWDHCSTETAENSRIANCTLQELQDQLPKTWRRNAGGIVTDSVCF